MVQCKRKSLISNVVADKKFNVITDKVIDTDKRQNTVANNQPNAIANKAVVLIRTKRQG